MSGDVVTRRLMTDRLVSCGLVAGPNGWVQTATFLVTGVLTVAFAIGLWRSGLRAGGVLIGVWGVGLFGAGLFVTDPVSGFPVGTPPMIDYTAIGALHDGFSLPGFLAFAAAQVVLSRGRGWKWLTYSLLSAAAFVVCFLLAGSGFSQTASLVDAAGLFQRLTVTIGWVWTVLLALRVLRRTEIVSA